MRINLAILHIVKNQFVLIHAAGLLKHFVLLSNQVDPFRLSLTKIDGGNLVTRCISIVLEHKHAAIVGYILNIFVKLPLINIIKRKLKKSFLILRRIDSQSLALILRIPYSL